MNAIGIDYAARSVYVATVGETTVKGVDSLTLPNEPSIEEKIEFLRQLKELLTNHNAWYDTQRTVYLETAWVNVAVNAFTGIQMTRMASYIEVAALECGLWPQFVMPQTWRKAVYGHGKPKDRKEFSRLFVLEQFGYDTKKKKEHNTTESICLAYYGILQGELTNISGGNFMKPTIGEGR